MVRKIRSVIAVKTMQGGWSKQQFYSTKDLIMAWLQAGTVTRGLNNILWNDEII